MLFDRILLVDSGSLTAQSISVSIYAESKMEQEKIKESKILPQGTLNKGIYIFFQTLLNLSGNYGSPILCLDKYPVRKLNQDPDYKRKRFERYSKTYTNIEAGLAEVPEGEQLSVHQQFRRKLTEFVDVLPCMTAWASGEEADDTMATALNQIGRVSQVPIFMFTRDTDMYQLVGSKPRFTIVYKSPHIKDHVLVNNDVVKTKYGVKPEQVPLYKAFLGDTGDGIPKIKRVFEKVVIKQIIENRTTVAEVEAAWDKGEIDITKWHKNWKEYFIEHFPRAYLNEKLARLDPNVNIIYEYRMGNYEAFHELFTQTLGVQSNLLTPITVWNHFVGIADVLIKTFARDEIPIVTK